MTKKSFLLFFLIAFLQIPNAKSQDMTRVRSLIDTLCSREFAGRGCQNSGCNKAGDFLENYFNKLGLKSYDFGFQQFYSTKTRCLQHAEIQIDKQKLTPAYDFIIYPNSPNTNKRYKILKIPENSCNSYLEIVEFLSKQKLKNKAIVLDFTLPKELGINKIYDSLINFNFVNLGAVVKLVDKTPIGRVANNQSHAKTLSFPIVEIKKSEKINSKSKKIKLDFSFLNIDNYNVSNVVGYVEGFQPDSIVVFTAHYDHLGMLGDTIYYPGAHDNASGVAMVCELANYYSKKENKPQFTTVFLLCSGEESGLEGSLHFVANSPFDLKKIKLVVNLDLVGSGSDGIAIANGVKNPKVCDLLSEKSEENNLQLPVHKRGEACNSDHCPFDMLGVNSIFIYTLGNEATAYHSPEDNSKNLPLTKFAELFKLLLTLQKH